VRVFYLCYGSGVCRDCVFNPKLHGGDYKMRINISLDKELTDKIKKIREQENRQSDADTLRALIKEALKRRGETTNG
jgi:hypothetical protein